MGYDLYALQKNVDALTAQGKYNEAIKASDEAIRLDPNIAMTWSNKGGALYSQGKYDDAIKAYDKAVQLDPKDAMFWNNKGIALEDLGRTTEADAAFTKAEELGVTGSDPAGTFRLSNQMIMPSA
jgi:Flp pilus assembly protein TadD